ncbi:MAG: hypothetical protein R3E04_07535 [Sphingobium sp.]
MAGPLHAGEGHVDQAEKLDVERGAIEMELQTVWAKARQDGENNWAIVPTVGYGVTDTLALGVQVEFEREGRDALAFSTLGLQAKWALLNGDDAPIGIGMQPAIVIDRAGRIGSETYFIAEMQREQTDLVANLIYSTEPGHWGEDALAYVLRADREIGEALAFGLETGGDLSGESAGAHWIGPVMTVSPGDDGGALPAFELSLFGPLSAKAPAIQIRLEMDWDF